MVLITRKSSAEMSSRWCGLFLHTAMDENTAAVYHALTRHVKNSPSASNLITNYAEYEATIGFLESTSEDILAFPSRTARSSLEYFFKLTFLPSTLASLHQRRQVAKARGSQVRRSGNLSIGSLLVCLACAFQGLASISFSFHLFVVAGNCNSASFLSTFSILSSSSSLLHCRPI